MLWGAIGGVVVGEALVKSGRELEVDGRRIELWGVRAPAFDQTCTSGDTQWACGAYAFAALYGATEKRSVWCVQKATADKKLIAQCYVGLADLAKRLVQLGWAEADARVTTKYTSAERAARQAHKGIWVGHEGSS